ncbi:glutamyl-tRNA(Gln) B subunit [Cordyceps militaris]|uniref:Glutamyl-tRNA(Gln) amidotransferase subunit B, mitochondrial n=1 Tax=Cordyceps militaris TaxID=73501 RepID=A0A2H4SIU8_CORMI|nr:glutamyl-tRNA(Gln) B subunit [Cordyceps militaris]
MPGQTVTDLSRYLLAGRLSPHGCLNARRPVARRILARSCTIIATSTATTAHRVRHLHDAPQAAATPTPPLAPQPPNFRKKLKDEARLAKKKQWEGKKKLKSDNQTVDGWELTVGIEIHAQLNTARKLFSSAATSFNDNPNSHVTLFDVAMPGSQPSFQKETLIPALRAALALHCAIQNRSRFDRKHYFWWDQPAGYQITQYYRPFAKNGHITLLARDGIAAEDGESVTVRIKQVQLEQDTAKTLAQVGNTQWLDFNRVGVPLVEIITEPEMHYPRTAAVFVRKIQLLLNTVDACVSGMEAGGLRADVNVSVRRTGDPNTPLGTRTEIKNLSTVKSVEDSIIAERDRQIRELEAGGVIASETRGWALGSTETRRLRGKEGEVDYRYMPDPDIEPLIIGNDLVQHLQESLAVLPDKELDSMVADYGLTAKDALSLITLDNGARVQYFYRVLDIIGESFQNSGAEFKNYATLVGNWVIHELGRLTTYKAGPLASAELTFSQEGECAQVPASHLAQLLYHLYQKQITGKVAKELLVAIHLGEMGDGDVTSAIDINNLWFRELSKDEYVAMAEEAMQGEDKVLQEFIRYDKFPQGKLMFLVGKMMRLGPTERIDPSTAESVMRAKVDGLYAK